MEFKNYVEDWQLSIEEFEKGGYGSSMLKFRVPALYQEYFTDGNVFNRERAFKEIATILCNVIVHRYMNLLSKVDLLETALNIGTNPFQINSGDTSFRYKLKFNLTIPPQINETIYFTNPNHSITSALTKSVRIDETDSQGLTYIIETVEPLSVNIKPNTDIYINNRLMYVFMPHTIANVKGAIYKGIQHASLNREFWQITKDSSFSGSSFSFSSQLSSRVLTNDILGIEANAILENAQLFRYELIQDEKGNKRIYYNNELIYTSTVFDPGQFFNFNVLYDDNELTTTEGYYE